MNQAAGGSPLVFTTTQKAFNCGGCSRQRQDLMYHFCCRDHMFLFTAHQHQHRLLSPKALLTFLLLSSTCVSLLLTPRLCLRLSRVTSSTPHSLAVTPVEDLLLSSHVGSFRFSAELFLRSRLEKVSRKSGGSHLHICIYTYSRMSIRSRVHALSSSTSSDKLLQWLLNHFWKFRFINLFTPSDIQGCHRCWSLSVNTIHRITPVWQFVFKLKAQSSSFFCSSALFWAELQSWHFEQNCDLGSCHCVDCFTELWNSSYAMYEKVTPVN